MICPISIRRSIVPVLLLLSGFGQAQTKTDSLLHVWRSGKPDASTYNELIWAYVFNQPDSAIYFGKRGLDWVRKHREDSLLGGIQNRIGVAYDIKSMPDSALYYYGLALKQSRKTKNLKTEGGALNNIGLIYWNKGETEKAIDHYIRSAEIFEKINDMIGLGNNYNNIALILHEDGQHAKSLRYHRQALQIRKRIKHTYGIAASYSNIGQLYFTGIPQNYDSALYYLELSIPLKQELKDQYGLARTYHSIGDIHLNQGHVDKALTFMQMTLKLQLAIKNAEGYTSTYYNISGAYSKLRDHRMQLIYLDSAETFATANDDRTLLWKIYRQKASALSKTGSFEAAYPYWVRYSELKDSLLNVERSEKVEELETRFRTAEQEKELAAKQSALALAQLKVENRNKWVIGLVSGLISLILLGTLLFQTYRRKIQDEKYAAVILERERGLRAMIQATEEERKRIAKDLHDGIVQTLTGLSLRLQKQFVALKADTEQQKKFQESQAMLNDSISEVRTISHQMMPRVLSEMGLIPAIDDMLGKSLGNTDIIFEFEHHKVEGERFAENVEVGLYRICQELVNNIIKHSEAKAVSVQLFRTSSHLVMVVEDNGKGFTFESTEDVNGIGLMNITSRAKAMKGEVNYQPSPKQGTVATIRIPLT